ncbi:MAG TPA: GNAT family N-acetyltransferase [Terriglobia bacterium]
MLGVEAFSTERLLAERIAEKHFSDLYRMWRDARVMETLGGVRSEQESLAQLGMALAHWERYGFGMWVLREKTSGELAGHAGLRFAEFDGWPELDLGYSLRPEFWGKGLATEIASAVVSLGFEKLGSEHITAISLPTNIASRRVLEKIGFRYERDTVFRNLPHVLYRIQRAAFLSSQTEGQQPQDV